MTLSVSVILFAAIVSSATASSLIDKWGRCKITDPNLNECLSKACSNMAIDLRQGNAELGISPFEPFKLKQFDINPTHNGAVNLKFFLKDLEFHHLTESELIADASQLKDMIIKFTLNVPIIDIIGKYKMNGKLLAIPIRGAGDMKLQMKKTKFECTVKGTPIDREGKSYWHADEFKVTTIDPALVTMEFSGLFNGDKKLGDATNKVMNDNWKLMLSEFLPYFIAGIEQTLLPDANIITQLEPFDEMFPK